MLCLLACSEFGGRFRARIRFLPFDLFSPLPSAAEIDQDDTILEYLLASSKEEVGEEAAAAIFSEERGKRNANHKRISPLPLSLRRE